MNIPTSPWYYHRYPGIFRVRKATETAGFSLQTADCIFRLRFRNNKQQTTTTTGRQRQRHTKQRTTNNLQLCSIKRKSHTRAIDIDTPAGWLWIWVLNTVTVTTKKETKTKTKTKTKRQTNPNLPHWTCGTCDLRPQSNLDVQPLPYCIILELKRKLS